MIKKERRESRNLIIRLQQKTRNVVPVLGFEFPVQFRENPLPPRPSNRKKMKDCLQKPNRQRINWEKCYLLMGLVWWVGLRGTRYLSIEEKLWTLSLSLSLYTLVRVWRCSFPALLYPCHGMFWRQPLPQVWQWTARVRFDDFQFHSQAGFVNIICLYSIFFF